MNHVQLCEFLENDFKWSTSLIEKIKENEVDGHYIIEFV